MPPHRRPEPGPGSRYAPMGGGPMGMPGYGHMGMPPPPSYGMGGMGGYPPRDSGYPPRDSGYPPRDSGYPPRDTGYYPRDGPSGGERKRSRFDDGGNNNDTICIRMIPPGCAEAQIRALVENFDGYRGMKLLTNSAGHGQPLVCFVLFESSQFAQAAIPLLQGQELEGSDGGRREITIEMARRSLQLDD